MSSAAIGVFDSGVGGLSILRELRQQLPQQPIVYFADQANVPYGPRTLEEVRQFSEAIVAFLLDQQCDVIVVACNTASAAALHALRDKFGNVPFVGMEPAVKSAAEQTLTQVVAVLATPATFQGQLFASVVDRFAEGIELVEIVLPGLVDLVEAGSPERGEVTQILERGWAATRGRQVDQLVLACTHYAFVIPEIRALVGPHVQVIDPAPAIARQTQRVLNHTTGSPDSAQIRLITSGDPATFRSALSRLIGLENEVEAATWEGANLSVAPG